MGFTEAGNSVNIETDMIGKYVESFTRPFSEAETRAKNTGSSVDEKLLSKTGFM